MTPTELRESLRLLNAQENALADLFLEPNPIWTPLPGPQQEAWLSEADELYYGGGAGGGKSALLVGLALTAHRKSIIFRREYGQLRDLLDYSQLVAGLRGRMTQVPPFLRMNDGRRIEYGAVEYVNDVTKFQGRPHDLKCVGRGTPVRMADGSYRPIEVIRPGDYVATLEGPLRVTRALRMGIRDAVTLTVRVGAQRYSQVQSRNHQILTPEGWVAFDTCDALHQPATSSPTARRVVHRYAESTRRRYATLPLATSETRSDLPHLPGWPECPEGCRSEPGSPFCTVRPTPGTDCAGSADLHATGAPRALRLPFRLGQRIPAQPLWGSDSTSAQRAIGDVPTSTGQPDSQERCSCGSHRDDGHAPRRPAVVLACPHTPNDAGARSPRDSVTDAQERTPTRSRCTQEYAHPYTRETRRIQADTQTCAVAWSPADCQELFDLTVESANHFITGTAGVVNRNCFDELPQFLESQYRFLIGWNRSTIPGQRCRVVGAGNPPTDTDGEWVIRRWAPWLDVQHPNPALPGELRWFAVVDGGDREVEDGTPFDYKDERIEPRSRTFIPARLSDNPYLERSGYRAILQAFPEPLRSQMLYGDFTAGTDDDPWQVIPTAWVRAAQARWSPQAKPSGPMTAVGVDVARGGRDKSALAKRWGSWFAPIETYPGQETPSGMEGRRLVSLALTEGGEANIDVIGVGSSWYDMCREAGLRVHAINFGEGTDQMDRAHVLRFVNVRAYAYWSFREALDPEKGDSIMLPPDPELRADLCAAKWKPRTNGILVEPKEEIIERIGRSPDKGDAVVLSAFVKRTNKVTFY